MILVQLNCALYELVTSDILICIYLELFRNINLVESKFLGTILKGPVLYEAPALALFGWGPVYQISTVNTLNKRGSNNYDIQVL